jgi:hypothetical protein
VRKHRAAEFSLIGAEFKTVFFTARRDFRQFKDFQESGEIHTQCARLGEITNFFAPAIQEKLNPGLKLGVKKMAMANLGSGQFFKETGASNPQVRVAEALGVIKPIKSGSGWRQFTQADVVAMRAWLRQQRKARRAR